MATIAAARVVLDEVTLARALAELSAADADLAIGEGKIRELDWEHWR